MKRVVTLIIIASLALFFSEVSAESRNSHEIID